jgi:hypothetical protein
VGSPSPNPSPEDVTASGETEGLRRDVLARRSKTVTSLSPLLPNDLVALGRTLLSQSRWSEAEPLVSEALAIFEKATPDDWRQDDAISLLGEVLFGEGRYTESEPLVVSGYEGMKTREPRIIASETYTLR